MIWFGYIVLRTDGKKKFMRYCYLWLCVACLNTISSGKFMSVGSCRAGRSGDTMKFMVPMLMAS